MAERARRGSLAGLTALAFLAASLTLGSESPSSPYLSATADRGVTTLPSLGEPSPEHLGPEELGVSEPSEESETEGRARLALSSGALAPCSLGLVLTGESFARVARSRAVATAHAPRGPPVS